MVRIVLLLLLGLIGCSRIDKNIPVPTEKQHLAETASARIANSQAKADESEMHRIISLFSKTIEDDPDYAGAYYNRAISYFYLKDYEKSWQDVHKSESLGLYFSPDFIEALKNASKRQN